MNRSWLQAEVAARLAVRSGVSVADFLRARVAHYAATLPVPLDELGIDVTVDTGEPVIRARGARPYAAAGRADAAANQPGPEISTARAQLETLGVRVAAARTRLESLTAAVAEDLASGKLPAAPGVVDASLEQCGRPPVPHPAPQVLLRTLAFALLASAAYRMAAPALAVAGISTDDLAAGLAHEPVATVAGILFGLGAAVSVYAFLNVAVERWQELVTSASTARRPAVLLAAGASALLLSVAVALAAIQPGLMAGPLLLVCVPLAAVLVLRQAARLEGARAQAWSAALEWDRARARDAGERARRGEAVAGAEAALTAALDDQAAAEERLRALEKRAAEEARDREVVATESARRVEWLAETLAASLELDRYAFVRRSAALARDTAALRPIRSRPAAVDAGVDGPLEAAG